MNGPTKYGIDIQWNVTFTVKKEGNCDSCYNTDETGSHYAKWNKPVTKEQILCDSITCGP